MKCFAVKNYSKSQDRVWILILGNRLHGNRDLEGSRHAHDRGIRLRSDNFEFANSVAHQPIHIVTIVFARNDGESRRLNQLFRSRGKIGRHECRTQLLIVGGTASVPSHFFLARIEEQDSQGGGYSQRAARRSAPATPHNGAYPVFAIDNYFFKPSHKHTKANVPSLFVWFVDSARCA